MPKAPEAAMELIHRISRFVLNNTEGLFLNNLQDYEPGLPVVAFKFSDDFKKSFPHLQQKWIQTLMRTRGW